MKSCRTGNDLFSACGYCDECLGVPEQPPAPLHSCRAAVVAIVFPLLGSFVLLLCALAYQSWKLETIHKQDEAIIRKDLAERRTQVDRDIQLRMDPDISWSGASGFVFYDLCGHAEAKKNLGPNCPKCVTIHAQPW